MNLTFMLGTGLIKKEKKAKTNGKLSKTESASRRLKRNESVELFLREILGTHLIQLDKKIN